MLDESELGEAAEQVKWVALSYGVTAPLWYNHPLWCNGPLRCNRPLT